VIRDLHSTQKVESIKSIKIVEIGETKGFTLKLFNASIYSVLNRSTEILLEFVILYSNITKGG